MLTSIWEIFSKNILLHRRHSHVGMDERGETFIGIDCRPGNHWTFAHYDIGENILLYGDSLGWEIPDNLNENISLFTRRIYNHSDPPVTKMCHNPSLTDNRGAHFCDKNYIYPLPKCFNVCRVISILIMIPFRHQCFVY